MMMQVISRSFSQESSSSIVLDQLLKRDDGKQIPRVSIHGGLSLSFSMHDETLKGFYQKQGHLEQYSQLVEKISAFADVADDELRPSSKAINDASFFIEYHFRRLGLLYPSVRLIKDGEINFLIDNEKLTLDVAIFGDNTFSYYALLKDSGQEMWMDLDINDAFPLAVYSSLKIK